MAAVERVLVVGAGIAGLAASIALGQVGIEVDLIEIQREPSTDGTGIQQPVNAIRAFDALGVLPQLRAQGFPFKRSGFYERDGRLLAHMVHQDAAFAGNGIVRPRLHAILVNAARDAGVRLRVGLSVDSLEQSVSGVAVELSDGGSARYDLLVGADGIRSRVRRLVFGESPSPKFTGEMVWRCNLPRLPELEGTAIYTTVGARAGLIPIGADLMYIFLIEPPPAGEMRIPADRLAATFRDHLAGYGGAIGSVRDTLLREPDLPIIHRPLESLMLIPSWHRGRVVIIGDAAHAMTPHLGQGAAQAVEDGVVLARLLAREDSVVDALAEFMARRYERCLLAQESSLQVGQWELERRTDADFVGVQNRISEVTAKPFLDDLEHVALPGSRPPSRAGAPS